MHRSHEGVAWNDGRTLILIQVAGGGGGSKAPNLPPPTLIPSFLKTLLVRWAFPVSAHKQFTSTLQAINPVVFIQAVFTLAVE